jgi:hypothetical protein
MRLAGKDVTNADCRDFPTLIDGDTRKVDQVSNAPGAYSFQPSGGLLPLAIWRVL